MFPRKFKPFENRTTPYNPLTGQHVPLVPPLEDIRSFEITSIEDDFIGCTNGVIWKPFLLRRTPFDGEIVNGITYTYSDGETRSATDGVDTETQLITPDYYIGEEILCVLTQIGYVDLNTAGRCWAVEP